MGQVQIRKTFEGDKSFESFRKERRIRHKCKPTIVLAMVCVFRAGETKTRFCEGNVASFKNEPVAKIQEKRGKSSVIIKGGRGQVHMI